MTQADIPQDVMERAREAARKLYPGSGLAAAAVRSEIAEAIARAIMEEQEIVAAAVKRAGERLGGIETPAMRGDNLSILLCSEFEDPDEEIDDDYGWTRAAIDGCDEVLSAIREHYATAIRKGDHHGDT